MKIPTVEIKKELCKRSFYYFVKEFIDVIEPNAENFIWNWHIEYLCNIAQEHIEDYINGKETKNLNINICPGTSKSTIFSRMLTPYIWARNPEITIINVTRSSSNVKNFSIASKQIINSEKYQNYFGLKIKSSPDSVNYFQNEKNGIRYGLTTNSKESTGKHADIIIFDDVQSFTDIYSEKELEQTQKGIDGFLSRVKDKKRSIIFNVMQRLGVNDMTHYLFERTDEKEIILSNFTNVCLPAKLSDIVTPTDIKSKYIDGLLDPIRLSDEILENEKLKFRSKYAPQYEQDPKGEKEFLIFGECNHLLNHYEWSEGDIVISATDPSGAGSDMFVTIFACIYNNKIIIFDAIRERDGINEAVNQLKDKLRLYKPIINEIETNMDSGVLCNLLMREGFNVNPQRESANKIVRIESFARYHPQIEWNRLGSESYLKTKGAIEKFKKGQKENDDEVDAYAKILRILHFNFNYLLK